MASYTELCEDALFDLSGLDENNDDYSALIEELNSENVFRSFGEGVLFVLNKKNPDITLGTAVKYIEEACKESGVLKNNIASSNTLKSWFKGGPRPKKGEDSRRAMFALAFALNLNPSETAELFHKVYLDRAFDFRDEKEIVYYFCLQNNKSWEDAKRLIDSINIDKSYNDHTIYTSQINSDLKNISEEQGLLTYIEKHGHNLTKKNEASKKRLEKLIDEAIEMVEFETRLQENRESAKINKIQSEDMYRANTMLSGFEYTNPRSMNHIYEVITGCFVRDVGKSTGTKTLFKNSRLPKEIKSRFPEAGTLSKKDCTYEEIRKLIILLFSYNYWIQANKRGERVDLDCYIDDLNVILDECGLSLAYLGNPYDWLFCYCVVKADETQKPIDVLRDIISEVLSED